ncbi:hypothetical protein, partial [Escherichia coli]|uniref:hypothetical protein n=1 Tax=Escherichia coli TaxID=562 RepID=UPI0019655C23
RTDTIFTVKPWPVLLDHYSGIFFKQVRNIFLHTVICGTAEVGKKQSGFIVRSACTGNHPPLQPGAEREDCLPDFCLRSLAERAI